MRCDPPKLGTGFGLKAGVYDDVEEVKSKDVNGPNITSSDATSKESRKSVSNVFDYDGCCLFSFIFVGYVSLSSLHRTYDRGSCTTFQAMHVGFLSARKDRLDFSDLPHLPYENRAENMRLPVQGTVFVPPVREQKLVPGKRGGVGQAVNHGVHGNVEHVGSWQLARLLYRGKGSLILICKPEACSFPSYSLSKTNGCNSLPALFAEWAKVLAGFIPPYCLHEIVESFDNEACRTDKAYPLLMCAGLFIGTFSESLLTAYVQ